MGMDFKFPKAQIATNQKLPLVGTLFLSLNDFTKPSLPAIANRFIEFGFTIVATTGTTNLLKMEGIPVERVLKHHEGHPHAGESDGKWSDSVNSDRKFKKYWDGKKSRYTS